MFYIKKLGDHMEENFNIHLGKKLRMRRLSLGLTQTKVALAINVTFQQIQKYEKGTNGVSSSRLLQLSNFLKVPIIYFYEDYKNFQNFIPGTTSEELNYAFLNKTFSTLSRSEKDKILQVLSNAGGLDKTG
jgi:transcriptional regulator with XRE-family HTH domain